MKQAICTIVAKNYLSLAFTLGESVKKFHPNLDFIILLSDSVGMLKLNELPYKVITLDSLNISDIVLEQMKFKYNVTEFSTSVKPFLFKYLFSEYYTQVIYFDPDILLFNEVTEIFDELSHFSIIVTPHILTCEINYTGTITESLLLHVGLFNFGFIAVSNDLYGNKMVDWWGNRLINLSFQDKIESLHTDQKWGDLLPSFFGDHLLISRDIGRNMAFWNLHERELFLRQDKYFVRNKLINGEEDRLLFYHFAGFDFNGKTNFIHKNHPEYIIDDYPGLKTFYDNYRNLLFKNGFEYFSSLSYSFDHFDNGISIQFYHRRIYRRLLDYKLISLENIFQSNGKLYQIFEKNNLIKKYRNKSKVDKLREIDIKNFNKKLKLLNQIMILLFRILGPDNYFLLLKFCQRYFRPENQIFLLKEFRKKYHFINENRQYTKSKD